MYGFFVSLFGCVSEFRFLVLFSLFACSLVFDCFFVCLFVGVSWRACTRAPLCSSERLGRRASSVVVVFVVVVMITVPAGLLQYNNDIIYN